MGELIEAFLYPFILRGEVVKIEPSGRQIVIHLREPFDTPFPAGTFEQPGQAKRKDVQ